MKKEIKNFSQDAKSKTKKYTGVHLIAEFWYPKIIEDSRIIKKILFETAKKANNTPLKFAFHKFSPQGFSAFLLLAESHISLHSWPELNYLAIDIFSCGEKAFPKKALEYLKELFQPKKIKVKEIKRGRL